MSAIINRFKNFLLPTEENQSEPVLLAFSTFALLFVLGAAAILLPAGIRQHELALLINSPNFDSADLVQLTNTARSGAGLTTLKTNDILNAAAQAKAGDMAAKGYFAHVAPNGKTPWEFIHGAGYKYSAAGENLALDFTSAEDAQTALMNSPTHRANILNKLYTEIGIAVTSGTYQGRPATFVVEYFAAPLTNIVQAPKLTNLNAAKDLAKLPYAAPQPAPAVTIKPKVAVLGEATLPKADPAKAPALVVTAAPVQTSDTVFGISFRYLAFVLVLFLLISLTLSAMRSGTLTFGHVARTIALVALFGYIGFNGIAKADLPQITPISFSTIARIIN